MNVAVPVRAAAGRVEFKNNNNRPGQETISSVHQTSDDRGTAQAV